MPPEVSARFDLGPTALLCALLRGQSDIPFARTVADAIGARRALHDAYGLDGGDLDALLAENAQKTEARYKCIGSAVRREGLSRVLELGCGISFRALDLTRDPHVTYVATDLPEMLGTCQRLMRETPELREAAQRPNVVFEAFDLLADTDDDSVLRHFSSGPLAIVNEGVLGYFTREEKVRVALRVRRMLERLGGAWITPDFATRSALAAAEAPATKRAHAAIARATGRAFADHAFESEDELEAFLVGLGYSLETRPMIDGSFALASPEPSSGPLDASGSLLRVLRLR